MKREVSVKLTEGCVALGVYMIVCLLLSVFYPFFFTLLFVPGSSVNNFCCGQNKNKQYRHQKKFSFQTMFVCFFLSIWTTSSPKTKRKRERQADRDRETDKDRERDRKRCCKEDEAALFFIVLILGLEPLRYVNGNDICLWSVLIFLSGATVEYKACMAWLKLA